MSRRDTVRSALVLGGALAFAIVLAVIFSLRIFTQLDRAASLQRGLVRAQEQLDDVVLGQIDQEAHLRELVAAHRAATGDDALSNRRVRSAIDSLAATTAPLGIPEMTGELGELRSLQQRWSRDVFAPLAAAPRGDEIVSRELLGKILTDQLRADTTRMHELLEARLESVQTELRDRLDQALFGGLISIVLFGGIAGVFTLSRAQILGDLARERSIVQTLQLAFLSDIDALPGTTVGTAYLSADRDAAVGGDLVDVRRLDAGRGLVVIADVSGKGIVAAVNTAFVKYTLRALARLRSEPAEIVAEFNRAFVESIRDPNLFVVVFVGIVDPTAGTLAYASAGHAGAWIRSGRSVRQLAPTGPIVGLDASFPYESCRVPFGPGEMLVLATDGLTEARDAGGTMLDDAQAIAFVANAPREAQACADALVAAVRARGGGTIRDDLALVAIARD